MKQAMLRATAFVLLVCLAVLAPRHGQAQPTAAAPTVPAVAAPGPLTIGIHVHPPFVMPEDGRLGGMAIALWEWLEGRLELEGEYVEFGTVRDLVRAVEAGRIDVAVTNLSVTRARAELIDFTHPWFDSGQRIMIREAGGTGFRNVVAGLRESGHLRAYGVLLAIILAATFGMTLFDRRFDPEFSTRWRDGLAESFHSVMSLAFLGRSGRKNLFGWAGRIWQGLWLVCGVAVLAYVTSSVTSVMTTLALTSRIDSVADLPGRPVAVMPGSVSDDYALLVGLDARPFERLEVAVAALLEGEVDAIIEDAPTLEYYAHVNPGQPVEVVGPIFAPDKYAFGLPRGSGLRRALSVEIIGARENGVLGGLDERYFGEE